MRELPKIYGDASEDLATLFLEQEEYVIIERNYFARKLGEIDIIAMKDNVLHFVEVKAGKEDFDPVYNLTASKLRKVINSAQYYMKSKQLDSVFCVDALIIRGDEIEFLENITV
ncbi:Predicted endonuclease distantly related to archaeal Holliday junction resolvase [hydrothermal vent metagenome]|uniref:Predicted endonuclease distantly related to archaeal Holliday junction resolvase n=1 Tax=hydrothermal vent metagenome TaxID=652676 RepID=A0A1W1EG91_9ZZZZ